MAKEPIDVTEKVEEIKNKKFAVSLPIIIAIFTVVTTIAAGYYELKTKFDSIIDADFVPKEKYEELLSRVDKLEEKVFQAALSRSNVSSTPIIIQKNTSDNNSKVEKKSKW